MTDLKDQPTLPQPELILGLPVVLRKQVDPLKVRKVMRDVHGRSSEPTGGQGDTRNGSGIGCFVSRLHLPLRSSVAVHRTEQRGTPRGRKAISTRMTEQRFVLYSPDPVRSWLGGISKVRLTRI